MVVKKSALCEECSSYIDYYIEERNNIKQIFLKCKCGNNQKIQLKNKRER